jgi:hypothetical protein
LVMLSETTSGLFKRVTNITANEKITVSFSLNIIFTYRKSFA